MNEPIQSPNLRWLNRLRLVLVLLLLFLFLVAIELLGSSFKAIGKDTAEQLVASVTNPFAGLSVGILATVLVQSSSVTTATIVGLVGSGQIPLSIAVPMVMGANVGTTITNTLVSLGHITRADEFRRAFAGATVHDFFNLIAVAVLFPLELATGFLRRSAVFMAAWLQPGMGGKLPNPLKDAVKAVSKQVVGGVESTGIQGGWLALALFVIALAMIVVALMLITKNMRVLMAHRIEGMLNDVLGRSGLLGLLIGIIITVSVQSSSITTSLLIPMFGSGILQLEGAFPIMIGANIGTTITALMAAMVAGEAGLIVALVHLNFNLTATLCFFPFRRIRNVPIICARGLADMAVKNRMWVVAYVGVVFVVIPALGILVFRWIGLT
ncbi:MAG: Na/Pi symporter [Planctomycetota bacterium]